jgi:hypothetical protein
MCTLSFIPTTSGYYAAMNRDERNTRELALPPKLIAVKGVQVIYPYERTGGTWIASNEYGITLALLNWNLERVSSEKQCSRGSIIPQLIGQSNLPDFVSKLRHIFLEGIFPFRLIGICPRRKLVYEWRWDSVSLAQMQFDWTPRHWFSSGLSDDEAEQERGKACSVAWGDPAAGALPWLREIHHSHSPAPGPFSICVHRPDAKTVSYTEIDYSPERLKFCYAAGQPCQHGPVLSLELPSTRQRNLMVI